MATCKQKKMVKKCKGKGKRKRCWCQKKGKRR